MMFIRLLLKRLKGNNMKVITLTDSQYKKLLDALDEYCDEGPRDYGWQSEELKELNIVIREDD